MKASLVLLSVAATVLADAAHHPAKREHHVHVAQIARRNETQELAKRESFSGTATWYDVTPNAGACGDWMQPSEAVVALNSPQLNAYGGYQNGKPTSCYRWITISYNGQTRGAQIKDECPTCGWGSLDLSESLFQSFTDKSNGVFQMTWWFNDDAGGGNNTPQPSTPAWTPEPTPTTTWTPEPTPTTTSTSETPTTTSSPTSTTSEPSSSDNNSVQEVPTSSTSQTVANLEAAPQALLQLANFLKVAQQV